MRHSTTVRVGPRIFRVGSDWRRPIWELETLYADYEKGGIPHFTVRLEATNWWRRWLRPQLAIAGDHMLPDAVPVALHHGLLAAEMAMNLQMALGERRVLLLHAATVERGGKAVILTGESGSGKSTLAALLMARGWRFMGDEFALIDPASGLVHPFPRPVSLKNESIAAIQAAMPKGRLGPLLAGTPKGDVRHLAPVAECVSARDPAEPVAVVFPRFGFEAEQREVGKGETFVRLTQASTNYTALGEAGFAALTGLVAKLPALAVDYPDGAAGVAAIEALA